MLSSLKLKLRLILYFTLFIISPLASYSSEVSSEINRFEEAIEQGHLEALPGGATNQNFILTHSGEQFFFRVGSPDSEVLGCGIAFEKQAMQAVSPLNIAPKPLYFSEKNRFMITEFIQQAKDHQVDIAEPRVMLETAKMLKKLHHSKLEFTRTFSPYETIDQLLESLHSNYGAMPNEFYNLAIPAIGKIAEAYSADTDLVPCHFDVSHRNLLFDGNRHWLVDWEFAAMGDPLLDIASVASLELWTDQQTDAFLDLYLDKATEEDRRKVYCLRLIIDSRWYIWCELQKIISTLDVPFDLFVEEYAGELLPRLRNPRYSFDDLLTPLGA